MPSTMTMMMTRTKPSKGNTIQFPTTAAVAVAVAIFLLLQSIALVQVEAADEVEFSYDPDSDVGPEFWKDIVMENNQCGGDSNSPVALESMACTAFDDYKFQSGTCTYRDYGFVINDHVEQASAPVNATCEAATLQIPGVDGVFELLQFHIHMNSEHTMNDNRYAAELHMVHKLRGGDRLAVVGLFIQANDFVNDDIISSVLAGFDSAADAAAVACNVTPPEHWWQGGNESFAGSDSAADGTVNVYGLIPNMSTFYNYDGGLTTPPCSEVVEWNVADKPLSISVAQYNDLSGLILNYLSPETCERATIASPSGSTSRPVQALNSRNVSRICPVGFVDGNGTSTSGAHRSLGRGLVGVAAHLLFFLVSAALVAAVA